MTGISEGELASALALAWCKDTAFKGQWRAACPSANQCAPTVLVVQDYLGGTLRKAPMVDVRANHLWNRLPDRIELDFTRGQFKVFGLPDYDRAETYSRANLLRIVNVQKRYALLKARVQALLET